MIRAGLQIPNFTYPGVAPDDLFERVADRRRHRRGGGLRHRDGDGPLLPAALARPARPRDVRGVHVARRTRGADQRVKLGTLVTGVTYRNPAILAKIVTALDVISRGRAFLGIGAAWFDVEHEALGVDFPPVKERFERLEEALQICRAMFRGERPTFEGKHYRVKDAINSPAPITPGGPPIMIGGSGEKKTLRMMAQYAEMANFTSGYDELPHKLEVLAQHCEDVGRDIDTINKTPLGSLVARPHDGRGRGQAQRVARRTAACRRGTSSTTTSSRCSVPGSWSATPMRPASSSGRSLDLGLDGFTVQHARRRLGTRRRRLRRRSPQQGPHPDAPERMLAATVAAYRRPRRPEVRESGQSRTAVAMRHGPSSNEPVNGSRARPRRSTNHPDRPSIVDRRDVVARVEHPQLEPSGDAAQRRHDGAVDVERLTFRRARTAACLRHQQRREQVVRPARTDRRRRCACRSRRAMRFWSCAPSTGMIGPAGSGRVVIGACDEQAGAAGERQRERVARCRRGRRRARTP